MEETNLPEHLPGSQNEPEQKQNEPNQAEIKPKIYQPKISFFTTIIICVFISFIGVYTWLNIFFLPEVNVINTEEIRLQFSKARKNRDITNISSISKKVSQKSEVIVKPIETYDPDDYTDIKRYVADAEIYIIDEATGEEKLFTTVENVNISHYHNQEFYNGNLYILKRIGDYNETENWTDELWRIDSNKNETKLFSHQGLDFRASADGKFIAVNYYNKESKHSLLVILNQDAEILKTFEEQEFFTEEYNTNQHTPNVDLKSWSDNNIFWGSLSLGPYTSAMYKIDIATWEITKYDLSVLDQGNREFNLNSNSQMIVYSDYPVMFDTLDAEKLVTDKTVITLYIYDFVDQLQYTIATSVAKQFKPEWINETTIEYNNPEGEDRIQFTLE